MIAARTTIPLDHHADPETLSEEPLSVIISIETTVHTVTEFGGGELLRDSGESGELSTR
jgi:hypothetical protein